MRLVNATLAQNIVSLSDTQGSRTGTCGWITSLYISRFLDTTPASICTSTNRCRMKFCILRWYWADRSAVKAFYQKGFSENQQLTLADRYRSLALQARGRGFKSASGKPRAVGNPTRSIKLFRKKLQQKPENKVYKYHEIII